jgi:Na+/melibiose symporter-like transporter
MTYQTTRKERISYEVYFFGQLVVFVIVSNYLQIFLTDIAIPATTVAVIFLIAKVWDGVNDPLFGVLVNRLNFKKGKYKPWLKVSSFLIPLCTVALFSIPNGFPMGLKVALAAIFYILWDMSYTFCDIPIFSITTVMTTDVLERNNIIAKGRLVMYIGVLAAAILLPQLYPAIGWSAAVAVLSAAALITMVPLGYVAKERHQAQTETASSLKDLVMAVAKNKYLMVFTLAFVVMGITNTAAVAGSYFAIYRLGGPGILSLISLLGIAPAIVIAGFVPMMIKRLDKFYLVLITMVGSIVISIVMYAAGYASIPVYLVLSSVRSMFSSLPAMLLPMFYIDCAEYCRYRTGENTVAVSVSIQTFASKIYTALSSTLGMFVLGLSGFVSGQNVTQPESALNALWIMVSLAPIIGTAAGFFILLAGYKLRDRDVQLMTRVNNGELSREEIEGQLSPKL